MPNPHRYFVKEREDGTFAVKGQGKERGLPRCSRITKSRTAGLKDATVLSAARIVSAITCTEMRCVWHP